MKITLGNPALAMVAILYGFMPYLVVLVAYLEGHWDFIAWERLPIVFAISLIPVGLAWICEKMNSNR